MIEEATILRSPSNLAEQVGAGDRRIAGVVLLGGSVRPTRFHGAIGRSLVELPEQAGKTLLDAWCEEVSSLASHRGGRAIPVRVLTDQVGAELRNFPQKPLAPVTVDRDPSALRGTGGVLRDISSGYGAEDLLLVANAAQFLLRPLHELVERLDGLNSDIAVLAHADGTPSTLMLVRCASLRGVAEVGFVDMKEQAIPQIAKRFGVQVATEARAVTLGLRTAESYLAGLRAYWGRKAGLVEEGLDGENWRSAFAIVEEGATVEPGARLHDSVVLRGATVGRGAVLVRSVACEGAVISRNRTVVDRLTSGQGEFSTSEEAT